MIYKELSWKGHYRVELTQISPKNTNTVKNISRIAPVNCGNPYLKQLEKKGYLKRNPHNSADYQILTTSENPISYINFYGKAQCGRGGCILNDNPEFEYSSYGVILAGLGILTFITVYEAFRNSKNNIFRYNETLKEHLEELCDI